MVMRMQILGAVIEFDASELPLVLQAVRESQIAPHVARAAHQRSTTEWLRAHMRRKPLSRVFLAVVKECGTVSMADVVKMASERGLALRPQMVSGIVSGLAKMAKKANVGRDDIIVSARRDGVIFYAPGPVAELAFAQDIARA